MPINEARAQKIHRTNEAVGIDVRRAPQIRVINAYMDRIPAYFPLVGLFVSSQDLTSPGGKSATPLSQRTTHRTDKLMSIGSNRFGSHDLSLIPDIAFLISS